MDIDETFFIIVNLYQKKKEEIGNDVKKLFYAADVTLTFKILELISQYYFMNNKLDKNDCIELNEFVTIYRYLEKDRFDKDKVSHLFLDSADIITSEG